MGTPKKFKNAKKLKSLTLIERYKLSLIGEEIAQELDFDNISYVLEKVLNEMRIIILPVVEWIDHPLFLDFHEVSPDLRKKRGILLFEVGCVNVALQRSGKWLVWNEEEKLVHGKTPISYKELYFPKELAEIIISNDDRLELSIESLLEWKRLIKDVSNAPLRNLIKKATLLKGISFILTRSFMVINQLIKEREERLNIIKERVDVLELFHQSLTRLEQKIK